MKMRSFVITGLLISATIALLWSAFSGRENSLIASPRMMFSPHEDGLSTFSISYSNQRHLDSALSTLGGIASVKLRNDTVSYPVFGGGVYLNDIGLTRYQDTTKAGFAHYYDTLSPVFDGRYYRFEVLGSSRFPALVDSIKAPNGTVSIKSPLPGATVSKSAGFTISWDSTWGIVGGYITIDDTVTTIGKQNFTTGFVGADPATYSFTSSDLGPFISGQPIRITVVTGNRKFSDTTGKPNYAMAMHSMDAIWVMLGP